ncbi:conserved Plasmodium protein, unknown function, partial [Plasmodium malariae]
NELLERLLKYEEKGNISPYILDKHNTNSNDSTNIKVLVDRTDDKIRNSEINRVSNNTKGDRGQGEGVEKSNYKSSYVGGENKKKILTVNHKEDEFNKEGLNKMKDYFKNILTVNNNVEGSKYYENIPSKNDEKMNENINSNMKDNNEEGKKTKIVIPEITFSESSLSNKNTLQKNVIVPTAGDDNLYLTEEKKRELRKKRFGAVSTDEALESRAKRFCIVTHKMEEENKKKRAERFGLNMGKLNDFETKKKRAERFGLLKEVSEKLC